MSAALAEGLSRAIADDAGVPQDHTQASYAAPFTEEEAWVDLREPQRVIQRKEAALNLMAPGHAKVMIEQAPFTVMRLEVLPQESSGAAPGQWIETNDQSCIAQAGDGPLRLEIQALVG